MPKQKTRFIQSLIQCVQLGRTDDLQRLLKEGKDPALTDNNGWTSIHFAAYQGRLGALQLLMTGSTSRKRYLGGLKTWMEETPLLLACKGKGDIDVVAYLLSCGSDVNMGNVAGQSPLFMACAKKGNLELVRFLIERGADVNKVEDMDSFTPLQNAIYEAKDLELIEYLAPLTNFSLKNASGNDALHLACTTMPEAVECLLSFTIPTKAHIAVVTRMSQWPLICRLMRACKDIHSLLLEDTVPLDDHILPSDCYLPLHHAIHDVDVFQMVLNATPPLALDLYEVNNGLRSSLPVTISVHSRCPKKAMEYLLKFNQRENRVQNIFHNVAIPANARALLCKYFILEDVKTPKTLQARCRVPARKAIRSERGSDWSAYCWLRDAKLPLVIKNILRADPNS